MPRAAPVMSTMRPSRCAWTLSQPADDVDGARGLVEHGRNPVTPWIIDGHSSSVTSTPAAFARSPRPRAFVEQHLVTADLHQQRRPDRSDAL